MLSDPVRYTAGQVPNCPHCGKPLEDPIEDFTVPRRVGPTSRARSDCGWCDKEFVVENLGEGHYELTALAGTAGPRA